MLLHCSVDRERTAPRIGYFLGDNVDNAAHGVRTVKRGHRTANDFDALDSVRWRQEALLKTGIAVGAGVTSTLAFAVHEKQRIGAGKAANENVTFRCRSSNRNALNIFQRIGEIAIYALFQVLARNDRNARRSVGDVLLEAGRSHHNLVELDRAIGGCSDRLRSFFFLRFLRPFQMRFERGRCLRSSITPWKGMSLQVSPRNERFAGQMPVLCTLGPQSPKQAGHFRHRLKLSFKLSLCKTIR